MRLSGPGFLLGVPVLGGLFSLVTAVILARMGGRLLGIRLRWRRAILAGFAGLVLGSIAAWSINGQRRGPQAVSWPAVLFGALVATMLIAVLLELLARPGRLAAVERRLRASPVPHPLRAARQRAGRSRRYLQVTRIAARHGLGSYLGGRRPGADEPGPLARNLRAALIALGRVLLLQPGGSARSGSTRGSGSRCSSAQNTAAAAISGGGSCSYPHPATSAWSACPESPSRPGRASPGGKRRMPAVNGVGERCAGEPHARSEAAGAGNGAPGHGHRREAARRGNPGG